MYKNVINSTIAKRDSNFKSFVFINLKLLDSIAKKLRPIIFSCLYAVINPNIVKILDKSTVIPNDFIFIAIAPKSAIIGIDKNMLMII